MAQPPAIVPDGILNAASRNPPSSVGGDIARGSRFEITGVRLGTTNVKVSLTQSPPGAAGTQVAEWIAPVFSVTPRRIEALMPAHAPLGEVKMTVTREGEVSKPRTVNVVRASLGLFSTNGAGWGPARFSSGSEITFTNPGRPGTIVTISGTGLGLEARPEIVVGGRAARVTNIVLKQGRDLGIDEIQFRIPPDSPLGCFVPVYAKASASQAPARWISNAVTIPIARHGPCKVAEYWPMKPVPPGETAGLVVLSRESIQAGPAGLPSEATSDHGLGSFLRATGSQPVVAPPHLLPPPGTCIFSAGFSDPDLFSAGLLPFVSIAGLSLDLENAGGYIQLNRPGMERILPLQAGSPGVYASRLGGINSGRRDLPLFLDPGEVQVSSPGGERIGPFTLTLQPQPDFIWLNRDAIQTVDRDRGVGLTWQDSKLDRRMIIFAVSIDRDTRIAGECVCVAKSSKGMFFLGPDILASLPPTVSSSAGLPALVGLAVIEGKLSPPIPANGLDTGFAASLRLRAKQVTFR